MRAEKSGREQQLSPSLRTSEKSTTRLSDSARLMGTLTHTPDRHQDSDVVAMHLPSDGTGDALSVRPATKTAVQVFGSLSRVGKKLRDSHESLTNKRTQSQAGIDQEGDDHRVSKRLRTSDPDTRRVKSPVNPHVNPDADPYGDPGDQPAPQAFSQPAVQPTLQPAVQPSVQRSAQTSVHAGQWPVAQPVTQVPIAQPAPVFSITPDMRAQIDMAEALRMAKSITPFQPEKISTLFEHLCRSQLWPLLKMEEQRALYLMNLQSVLPMSYGVPSGAVAGRVMMVDAPASSTMTTTTTQPDARMLTPSAGTAPNASTPTTAVAQRAPLPIPVAATPITAPITAPTTTPMARAVQSALEERAGQGNNASRVSEELLPFIPNPPSPTYAKRLLDSLPPGTQSLMKSSAGEIRKMLGGQKLDLATTNNMTAFVCLLVEITSHGGLPQLNDELDSIVQVFLQRYLTSHRHRENENKRKVGTELGRGRGGKDPAHAQLLRLLPKYPQFARVLGNGINNLETTHRTHLGLTRKFNAVLTIMKERHYLSEAQFKQRLNEIIDDASSPESSPAAATSTTSRTAASTTASNAASTAASTTASRTTSTPTSTQPFRLEGGEDEGSDGEI